MPPLCIDLRRDEFSLIVYVSFKIIFTKHPAYSYRYAFTKYSHDVGVFFKCINKNNINNTTRGGAGRYDTPIYFVGTYYLNHHLKVTLTTH